MSAQNFAQDCGRRSKVHRTPAVQVMSLDISTFALEAQQ
jgi:hypothetical protein